MDIESSDKTLKSVLVDLENSSLALHRAEMALLALPSPIASDVTKALKKLNLAIQRTRRNIKS